MGWGTMTYEAMTYINYCTEIDHDGWMKCL